VLIIVLVLVSTEETYGTGCTVIIHYIPYIRCHFNKLLSQSLKRLVYL